MPEVLWKAYIDFEISEGEGTNVRSLYSRLLERTNHVKVWISFAQFEASEIGGGLQAARKTFQDGFVASLPLHLISSPACSTISRRLRYDSLKAEGLKEERVVLLEAWKAVEEEAVNSGQEGDIDLVLCKLPRKIKMRRMVAEEASKQEEPEWEEYYDYHFPDDEKKIGQSAHPSSSAHSLLSPLMPSAGIKILENALKWKQMMASGGAGVASSTSPEVESEEVSESGLGKRKDRDGEAEA
jgi:hypothetical protein